MEIADCMKLCAPFLDFPWIDQFAHQLADIFAFTEVLGTLGNQIHLAAPIPSGPAASETPMNQQKLQAGRKPTSWCRSSDGWSGIWRSNGYERWAKVLAFNMGALLHSLFCPCGKILHHLRVQF